jgi:phospholipase/carboxylesterase
MAHASGFPAVDEQAIRWSIPRDQVARELSGASGDARPLLIMLHGYGSHELDLFGLAEFMPAGYVVASVRGLMPAGNGYSWFSLEYDPVNDTLKRDATEANAAARVVVTWLESLEAEVGEITQVVLLGFSQGGAMCIQMLRNAPERFAAAVVLASFAVPDDSPGNAERDSALAAVNVPVFWGRDPHDPVISDELIAYTRRWLPEHSDLDARLYANVGHGISMEEIQDVSEFLGRVARS